MVDITKLTWHLSRLIAQINDLDLGEERSALGLSSGKCTADAVLRQQTINAVCRVQVLDHDKLEASGRTLARGNRGPSQEQLPDTVPALAKLGANSLGVANPVAVPAPKRTRVVDSDSVDAVDVLVSIK